jgi:hypothetical protein
LNSELLQERQFQAEMDRRDFIMARAQEIIEHWHRGEAEDNDIHSSDSDSELLVLASSIFNGMGGIEESNIISVDSDVDEETIDVQGSVFSPRKTRSGRVVQC